MHIAMVGTGYVGLVTGAIFSEMGNRVACIDIDAAKVERLRRGETPIHEPSLPDVIRRNVKAGRLTFTTSYAEGMRRADFVFIAVPTPTIAGSDAADLTYIRQAAMSIAAHLDHDLTVVIKSTVPIGTGRMVANLIEHYSEGLARFSVVSNPEFLREGSAVTDCLHPDRVVIGADQPESGNALAGLYSKLRAPILITNVPTAEMIKYASNAMLATRISFMNEIATLCEAVGADVKKVALGMGHDRRIGHAFLDAGVGYGGSCFPKDVRALSHMMCAAGYEAKILTAVHEVNVAQSQRTVEKLRRMCGTLEGRVVGLLGLAFKPNTDDLREAPAIGIARLLTAEGARVKAFDPVAMAAAQHVLPEVTYCQDSYHVAEGSDVLIAVTEWEEFKHLDMDRIKQLMRKPVILDARNMYDPEALAARGFTYEGTGRGNASLSDAFLVAIKPDPTQDAEPDVSIRECTLERATAEVLP